MGIGGKVRLFCKVEKQGRKECSVSFTHKSTLNSHQVTHTGLKPFKCIHCEMSFARGHTMRKHIGRKHSENKFVRSHLFTSQI